MKHDVGFTGTRRGMTTGQMNALTEHLDLQEEIHYLHHGDCIGADVNAHFIAFDFGIQVVIHPPEDDKYRAYVGPVHIINLPRPYLDRNQRIVDESDYLIAAPASDHEVLRSGTWATVRYARKQGKRILILWPSGQTEWEEVKKNDNP